VTVLTRSADGTSARCPSLVATRDRSRRSFALREGSVTGAATSAAKRVATAVGRDRRGVDVPVAGALHGDGGADTADRATRDIGDAAGGGGDPGAVAVTAGSDEVRLVPVAAGDRPVTPCPSGSGEPSHGRSGP